MSARPGEQPPIYTKTGDDGTTGLLFGGRVSKADAVIEACGTLDEAVAALGLARATLADQDLRAIVLELQRGLFVAAAQIAANPRARDRLVAGVSAVTADMTAAAEQRIDELLAGHPLRPAFVVPGATQASAALDMARTFLRRAERRVVAGGHSGMPINATVIAYLEPRLRPRLRARAPRRRRSQRAAQPPVSAARRRPPNSDMQPTESNPSPLRTHARRPRTPTRRGSHRRAGDRGDHRRRQRR